MTHVLTPVQQVEGWGPRSNLGTIILVHKAVMVLYHFDKKVEVIRVFGYHRSQDVHRSRRVAPPRWSNRCSILVPDDHDWGVIIATTSTTNSNLKRVKVFGL